MIRGGFILPFIFYMNERMIKKWLAKEEILILLKRKKEKTVEKPIEDKITTKTPIKMWKPDLQKNDLY